MCYNSLESLGLQRVCVKETCKFYLVKGTRRVPLNMSQYNTYNNSYLRSYNNGNTHKEKHKKEFHQFTIHAILKIVNFLKSNEEGTLTNKQNKCLPP